MGEAVAVGKATFRPPKQILDTFYNLASYHRGSRNSAALKLLLAIQESKDAWPYCLERLVKGLASPRECARLGYSVVLTELLKTESETSCDEVFALVDKHLPTKGAGDDAKNNAIGQMLCLTALIRSKKCVKALNKTVERLNSLIPDRPYLETAWAQAMISISLLADDESFRNVVWPAVKTHCSSSLETCSPLALWMILELDKLHPKYLRKKAKILRGGDWPPTEEKRLRRLGEILAASARSVPSGVHPVERSLLSAMLAGEQFEIFWGHTVCGYLLKHDDKLVSSVGIRMIGSALAMQPSKKQLKNILSNETLEFLLKALLDRRQAARFVRTVAQSQLDAIHDYVSANKANAAVQFSVIKRILDVSLNFDSVSGSNLVHRVLSGLSSEAAALATEELISKLKSLKSGKSESKEQHVPSSEAMVVVKLLHRVFECSKATYATAHDYRSKILQLLVEATFMKPESTDLPTSLWTGPATELTRNILMRCLDEMCIIALSRLPNRPKFDVAAESLSIMADLIDALIDRKQRRLSNECKLLLKLDHVALAVKASKTYRQLSKSVTVTKGEKAGDNETQDKGFAVLVGYTLFWFLNEPDAYSQFLEDLLVCYEKSQEQPATSGPQWTDVLMDVLLGLLSRPHRHVRSPIQVAFHYFCPLFTLANIQPLLKALKPSETDNYMAEDDEDDDYEGDEAKEEENAEPFSSSGEESEADENADVNGEAVDPEFRRAIEDALGEAAVHSDTESTASDLTDEAMLKLDESLAAVFRSHLTAAAAKKSARDLAEQAQAFRMRCFDLLFVLLHSRPTADVLAGILLPILRVANEAVRINDQKNVFNRSRQVIERAAQTKALPPVSESSAEILAKLAQSIKEIVEFTRTNCTNPSVQLLAAECVRFLLKFGDSVTNNEKSELFESEVKTLFARHLEEYLKDRQCLTPTCVFTAAFQKRPQYFVETLPILIEAAFSEDVRPFRRHEACALVRCLLNKEALAGIKDKSVKKAASAWKRFVDQLRSGVVAMIAKQETGDDSEEKSATLSKSAKSGDLFEILALLRSVVSLREVVPLRNLQEDSFINELEKITNASKVGQMTGRLGQGPKKVKLSTVCSTIIRNLRPRTTENANDDERADGEEEAVEKEEQSFSTPRSSKRRKTKA